MSAAYAVLVGVWVASSLGTGWILALLARRIHPALSLLKLWVLYSTLMAFLVAVVFLVGWF